MIWFKRLLLLAVMAGVVASIVLAMLPRPVRVDIELVTEGPMEVSVRDDGRTRIRERYVVSTPIAGRLRRVELEVGDQVVAGETVIARMEPPSPALLDPRERAQTEARVNAAEGRLKRAHIDLDRVQAEKAQAEAEMKRQLDLRNQGAGTEQSLEQAQLLARVKAEEEKAAQFLTDIAQYELELEQAALIHVTRDDPETEGTAGTPAEFVITSPISGRVLRVMQESSAVLATGAALMELGDPQDLEVVVDILSSDAVRVKPGQRAWFENWGGDAPLQGTVRLVEPSGFTKISALGVEEQRVNVVLDFVGSLHDRLTLGDGYRVETRIVVWDSEDVISLPTGTLFRDGPDWAVFVVDNGHAHLRKIKVGENNGLRAQVLEGLQVGEQVILHPGDQVSDGVEILRRES